MNPDVPQEPAALADRWMAGEVFSELLASTDPGQMGQKLTEQLRELTGARTVMLIGHAQDGQPHRLITVSPERRAGLFAPDELGLFCPNENPAALPHRPDEFPREHPLREPLLRRDVQSLLRFPLRAGGTLTATLVLLDLPAPDRIDEVTRIVSHLSPVMALALRNALAHEQIAQQARELQDHAHELERRVADRTADLEDANLSLAASRLDAIHLMVEAVNAQKQAEETAAALQREILERGRTDQALQQSEERFRRAIVDAPFPILIHAEDGTIVQASTSWYEITGYTRDELATIGDWTQRAYGARKDQVQADIDALYGMNCRKAEGDYHIRTRSGAIRIWDFSSAPLGRLPDGRRLVISMALDVTERRQAEAALVRSSCELRDKNAELERFLYTISHDLKSPVVTIRTFLGYLSQDMESGMAERVEKDLHYMRAAADKMAQLINEVLELSRIGRVVLPPEHIALCALVDETLSSVAGTIAERGVQANVDVPDLSLFGDRIRLAEIWQNLVENAVKFMGDQKAPRIDIGVLRQGEETVFFVRDNGMGIDPRFKSKVFGLFEKIDAKAEGTGVGLAIVKRIVELYGGRIWVESAGPGQGAAFYFTLPGALDPAPVTA